ncbi:MAG: DUF1178 family protein [Pseudomonadota bacterium]|nr:DUF1178 family protein [Pseudomonadota bacterium]
MKVLNLRCGNDHRFEGWFASEDDFVAQESEALVQCPVCTDSHVVRLPSAPRLNVSNRREEPVTAPPDPQRQLQSQWLRAMRQMVANTEDVGERFPEEARRIHYGEVEERGIRGQASREDADALRDEGIEVMAVALPAALKGPVQ